MITVKFKKLRENFQLPKKAYENDSNYDVFVAHTELVDRVFICYLGFATEIEEGYKGVIVPRSSQTKTNWAMLNSPGQIEFDFRNEWLVKFTCLDRDIIDVPFEVGDRVAQIHFEKVNEERFIIVEELSETERGMGGFGHTGKR